MTYSYRYDPDAPPAANVAASTLMDPIRAQLAPTASQLRERVLAAAAAQNGSGLASLGRPYKADADYPSMPREWPRG